MKCVPPCRKLETTGSRGKGVQSVCVHSWTHRSLSLHCNRLFVVDLGFTAVGGAQGCVCVLLVPLGSRRQAELSL